MLDATLNTFRAVGEETRLRIMVLLLRGELTVTELTQILGQSQPRVSRHLKILSDAGLVERYREGSWMFYRAAAPAATAGMPAPEGRGDDAGGDNTGDNTRSRDRDGAAARSDISAISAALRSLAGSHDRLIARDNDRFEQSRRARAEAAAAYFEENAGDWDKVRRLHLPDADIERQMRELIGADRRATARDAHDTDNVDLFVDIGTGTGRMLELFADCYRAGLGFDLSREMLSVARANLDKAGVAHAHVRHGDLFALPVDPGTADIVCIHQVLHFLTEPGKAVREAAQLLKPGGKLLISDFAPHELEFLRDEHAHRRLGFSDSEVADWARASALDLTQTVTLSPKKSGGSKLTVKIWLCAAPASVRRLRKSRVA